MKELIKLNIEVETYIKTLQKNKQYKKSLAFIDYCLCSENGEYYSIRLNAERWNLKSSSTAHSWIKDFENIVDKIV